MSRLGHELFDQVPLGHFEGGDLREVLRRAREYDVVLYVSVGDVLGDLAQAVGKLRGAVRNRGLVIIDDAFRLSDPLGSA